MPSDSSIYGQVRQVQPVNALANYAQALQIQDAQQNQQLNALKMDEYQRGVQEANALRDTVRGFGADEGQNVNALLKAGNLKAAQDYQKANADRAKVGADADKVKLDNFKTVTGLVGNSFGPLLQNPATTYEDVVATVQRMGALAPKGYEQAFDPARIPTDPAALRKFLSDGYYGAIDAEKQMADKTSRDNNAATNATSIANNTATNAQSDTNNRRSVGAQYDLAKATREAAKTTADASREAATIKDRRDTEMKYADDYRNQSKAFKEVSDAYKQIGNTLDKATTSPAATLAGATKFMKLLDPGSVVRESELGMALQATGALDRATNYYNTLKYGKVLTKDQVADFKKITGEIYRAAQDQQKAIDADYTSKAKGNNLRPEMIVQDLGQNNAALEPSNPSAAFPSVSAIEAEIARRRGGK